MPRPEFHRTRRANSPWLVSSSGGSLSAQVTPRRRAAMAATWRLLSTDALSPSTTRHHRAVAWRVAPNNFVLCIGCSAAHARGVHPCSRFRAKLPARKPATCCWARPVSNQFHAAALHATGAVAVSVQRGKGTISGAGHSQPQQRGFVGSPQALPNTSFNASPNSWPGLPCLGHFAYPPSHVMPGQPLGPR